MKSPVAMHVNMAGRGGGQGYPGALLGTIAFTKQGLLDAQWQRDAEAHYTRTGGKGPRPLIEPALDALKPALARQMPVALDANLAREIDRALAIAAQFNLDPIVVGASEAHDRVAELQKAKARVIFSLSFPGGRGGGAGAGGAGGGRGGGAAPPSLAQLKAQQNAPKIPAALAQASVPFAFTSGDLPSAGRVRPQRRPHGQGRRSPRRRRPARAHDRRGAHRRRRRSHRIARKGQDRQRRRHPGRSVRRRHGPSRLHRRPADRSHHDAAGDRDRTRTGRRLEHC